MWECSKCGQKSEKKLSSSNGCEHQWWDEHDIAKLRENQAKEEKINRAVFAFNDELLNTEDGQKKLKGENGWSWLKRNKGGDKIDFENVDIDKDIAICWLNSFFGKKWLAGEYGKQYLSYLDETKMWANDKFSNDNKTELNEISEKDKEEIKRLKNKIKKNIIQVLSAAELSEIDEVKNIISRDIENVITGNEDVQELSELTEFLSRKYKEIKDKKLSEKEKPLKPVSKVTTKSSARSFILFSIVAFIATASIIAFIEKNKKATEEETETEKPAGELNDARDGKKYKYIVIGPQTWMAENLNYETKGSKCYGNKTANCDKYGRLYDWKTAKKSCPVGWHLPNNGEWQTIRDFAGGEKIAGKKLKAVSGWNSNGGGTDAHGFAALPVGYGNPNGTFEVAGYSGGWWSASENGVDKAYRWSMRHISDEIFSGDVDKGILFGVRCVKD